MSKFIKTIAVSAAILFGCLSAQSHAKSLPKLKSCGYEIYSTASAQDNTVIRVCLFAKNDGNYVTLMIGPKTTSHIPVSHVTWSQDNYNGGVRERFDIDGNILVKFTRDGYVQYAGIMNGRGQEMQINSRVTKFVAYPEDKKSLCDYGITCVKDNKYIAPRTHAIAPPRY